MIIKSDFDTRTPKLKKNKNWRIKILIKLKIKDKKINVLDQEIHWFNGLISELIGHSKFYRINCNYDLMTWTAPSSDSQSNMFDRSEWSEF